MSDDYKQGYREGFADGIAFAYARSYEPRSITPRSAAGDTMTGTLIHKGTEPTIAAQTTAQNVIDPSWVPLRHYVCGQISHYLTRRVNRSDTVDITLLRKLDGTVPDPKEESVCGYCGEPVMVWSAKDMDYALVFSTAAHPIRTSAPDPVEEVVEALAKLEADVVASSKPKPIPQACLRCFEMHDPRHACGCSPLSP